MTTTKTSEFKQTEIGEIPLDWDIANLEEILVCHKGKKPTTIEPTGSAGALPYLIADYFRTKSVKQYVPFSAIDTAVICEASDVIMIWDGSNAGDSFAGIRGVLASTMVKISPKNDSISPDYLYFLIKTKFQELNSKTTGATIPHISPTVFYGLQIPLPPIIEQTKICGMLLRMQKVVENQKRIVADLRELKSTTTAKLFHEGLRGESLKQTEIGELPKNWAVKRLSDIASLQGGFAFKSSDYKESGIRLFKIANVSFGKTIWDDISFLPNTYLEVYRDYVLKSGDIIMAMTRPIVSGGIKIAIASKNDTPCLLNQRVGRFILKGDIDPNYFYFFLFSDYFIRHIIVGADGAQQPNISSKKIEEALIPYPPLEEQMEIASAIQSISKNYDYNVGKLKELRALFSSTLNQLMTGKVRVS